MGIMNDISKEDIELMEDWLHYTHPNTNHMPWKEYLRFWADSKDKFLTKLFKGKTIHKFDCNIARSTEELYHLFEINTQFTTELFNIQSYLLSAFGEVYRTYTYNCDAFSYPSYSGKYRVLRISPSSFEKIIANDQIPPELKSSEFFIQIEHLCEEINKYSLYAKNAFSIDIKFRLPNKKLFRVSKGQKPIKVLTSFFEYICDNSSKNLNEIKYDAIKSVERLRIIQSQILNTRTTYGKLCLSIHPMDYMTMSDNDCNWHSCMRWTGAYGEYHSGTLEMMTSNSVIVAYLESDHEWHPLEDERTWSNKKWRELFIVTPDLIAGIKGYPYEHQELEKAVIKHLRDMMEEIGINMEKEFSIGENGYLKKENSYISFSTQMMYNDISIKDHIIGLFRKGYAGFTMISYGTGAFCIDCGRLRDLDEDANRTESLICPYCEGLVLCEDCGSWIHTDDSFTLEDGTILCTDCFNESYICCDITGEIIHKKDISALRIRYKINSIIHTTFLYLRKDIYETIPKDCLKEGIGWSTLIASLEAVSGVDERIWPTIAALLNESDIVYDIEQ